MTQRTEDDGVERRSLLKGAAGAAAVAGLPAAAEAAGGDIVAMRAVDLTEAIRARRLSCAEVMAAHLDRIERVNPKVNAIVALQDRDELMRRAAVRDDELARGEEVGPLHGLPHAVKDLQAVRGVRSTQGSPIFKDFVPTADSLPVERLRQAGVVFIGKTNSSEFGLGSHTFNPVYGVTRNAYDPTRSAGGSSGGAAVALALGMAPLADGSDYGGSLRNPAGWNGVYGFRTSVGRVPVQPRDVWLPSMGVQGPMARNVADLALLLSVQAGYDPRAPLSMESPGDQFRLPRAVESFKGRRIAWVGDFRGFTPCEPGVLDVCRRALKVFEDLGCLVEAAVPDYPLDKVWEAFVRLRGWQQGGILLEHYNNPARRPLLKAEAIFEIETGAALSAYDIAAASAVRSEWTGAVRALFDRYDYILAPTAQVFPFAAELAWPREIAGQKMATYHEWMKAVCLVTMAGCPALAVPAGFGPQGWPMGLQIIAPVHREFDCLALAAAYEAAGPDFLSRKPRLADG